MSIYLEPKWPFVLIEPSFGGFFQHRNRGHSEFPGVNKSPRLKTNDDNGKSTIWRCIFPIKHEDFPASEASCGWEKSLQYIHGIPHMHEFAHCEPPKPLPAEDRHRSVTGSIRGTWLNMTFPDNWTNGNPKRGSISKGNESSSNQNSLRDMFIFRGGVSSFSSPILLMEQIIVYPLLYIPGGDGRISEPINSRTYVWTIHLPLKNPPQKNVTLP